MKNASLFLFLFFSTFHSLISQNIDFPDANFKNALIEVGVDDDMDGEISQTEAQNVTSLNVSNKDISDMTGISYFTNLEVLYCWSNSLTSLDVSDLTTLVRLDCRSNSLTSLDVHDLTRLAVLHCSNNSLTSLDVSGLSNLERLTCSKNPLTSLDVSGLTNLKDLYCENTSAFSIDIRNTPGLENFYALFNPDLECVVVDDFMDFPHYITVEFDIFTTEPCLASFEGLSALVQGLGLPSITEAAMLTPLKVAEASCTAGKKWMAVTSLITLDAMVARLQQIGRFSAAEAGQILETSGQLQDDILSGAVDCTSGTPYNFLDWITSWYNLDAPGEGDSDELTTVQSGSPEIAVQSVPLIYPNPTAGHVTFSHTVNHVEVYNMMGQLMTKAEHTDHLDLHSWQSGVYVIRTMDDDGERSVQKVVKR